MEKLKAESYIMGNQNKDMYHVKWKSPRLWATLPGIATARVWRSVRMEHSPLSPGVNSDIHWRLLYMLGLC